MKYWKTTHNEEDSVYYLSRTTRNWALIVGLQPDTYYFVKVMAYNAAGEGPESERFEGNTYYTYIFVQNLRINNKCVIYRANVSQGASKTTIIGARVWHKSFNCARGMALCVTSTG